MVELFFLGLSFTELAELVWLAGLMLIEGHNKLLYQNAYMFILSNSAVVVEVQLGKQY